MRRRTLYRSVCFALTSTWLAAGGSFAAVSTTGQVDPISPATWNSATHASVGRSSDGSLTIDNGSKVVTGFTYLGRESGVSGIATIDGSNSSLKSQTLSVGTDGNGFINVEGGAFVSSYFGSLGGVDGYLDGDITSTGVATITGSGSTWESHYLWVGYSGMGTLTVQEQAAIQVIGPGYVGYLNDSSGEVIVTGAGSSWNGDIRVGGEGYGKLTIEAGAALNGGGSIGSLVGGVGEAIITGAGSSWNGGINVGYAGNGTLVVEDGATFNGEAGYIGTESGSIGSATIAGLGSSWISRDLYIGRDSDSFGSFAVRDGANVHTTYGYLGYAYANGTALVTGLESKWVVSELQIGQGGLAIEAGGEVICDYATMGQAGFDGAVTVTGVGSKWSINETLRVGVWSSGAAILDIRDGATVTSSSASIGYDDNNGRVTVSGAASTWRNSGSLELGDHGSDDTLTISEGGLVDIGTGIDGSITFLGSGHGVINLLDGGTLRLHGGAIRRYNFALPTFNFNGGRLEGVGIYQVGAGLTQNGGVLAPGNSAGITTIVGSYALNSGALEIELLDGSGVAGTAFDRLVVNSGVTLGSASQLNLLLGYAANVGDSFLIVDSKNSAPINGTFANDDELTAEFESLRYSFSLSYAAGTGNDIALTVESVALIGDYNGDGFVDAADYTVWRDAVGTSGVAYAGADGNGDGVVDEGDHAVWAAHYGASLEAAMAEAVPEPAGVVLAVLTLIAGGRRSLRSRGLCSAS